MKLYSGDTFSYVAFVTTSMTVAAFIDVQFHESISTMI